MSKPVSRPTWHPEILTWERSWASWIGSSSPDPSSRCTSIAPAMISGVSWSILTPSSFCVLCDLGGEIPTRSLR